MWKYQDYVKWEFHVITLLIPISLVHYFKLRFTTCKAEHLLWGVTSSNNISLRKVNVKLHGFNKMYMDRDLIDDSL